MTSGPGKLKLAYKKWVVNDCTVLGQRTFKLLYTFSKHTTDTVNLQSRPAYRQIQAAHRLPFRR